MTRHGSMLDRCRRCGSPFHRVCTLGRPRVRFHVRVHAGIVVALTVAGTLAFATAVAR